MFSQTDFQHVSGTRVVMDFVEVPSMFMEAFSKTPQLLSTFGYHYRTGEQIRPETLELQIAKQKRLYHLEQQDQLQMALLDQIYHSEIVLDPNFDSSLELYKLSNAINPIPWPAATHWQVQFSHLVTYGASYYSYAWCMELASSLQRNILKKPRQEWRESGDALRTELFACGGSRDPWVGLNKLGVQKIL